MAQFQDNLPQDADEVVQKMLTDTQRELEAVDNPNRANVFLQASWLRAIIIASGNRIFDESQQLEQAINLNMPDTATGEFVDRQGAIYVGARIAAVGSSGNIAATGTPGTVITFGSNYQSSDGITYVVTAATTITAQSLTVDTITLVGDIATVTTDDDHNLGSNVPVTIAGAVETDYNVTDAEIQVTGLNTFTYEVLNSPSSPATGTITADFDSGSIPIEAVVPSDPDAPFGALTNQILDTPLSLLIAIPGADTIANVDFSELSGGADLESDELYKDRYLDKIQNPVSHYASPDIEQAALTVAGVTRVFIQKSGFVIGTVSVTSINRSGVLATVVTATPHDLFTGYEVTIAGAAETDYNVTDQPILVIDDTTFVYEVANAPSSPATGTITSTGTIPLGRIQIYFVRDNDDDPIPSVIEIADVKTAVLAITPANTPDVFVLVDAPVALPVAFTFTDLFPDTTTMRSAVEAQLQQFFDEQVDVGVDVDQDAYRSAIFTTVDIESGDSVETFTLSTPTTDITVAVNELPTLGAVTFS